MIIPKGWKMTRLGEIVDFFDSKRIPLSSSERAIRKGNYPYYGASFVIDYVDDYLFDDQFLLISEDGENLNTRNTPIAFLVNGKFWVNNHAHVLKGKKSHLTRYLMYYFSFLDISPYLSGAVQPKLSKSNLESIPILIPENEMEQIRIVDTLSSFDDKIELLREENKTLEAIAQTIFKEWFMNFNFPDENGNPYKSFGGKMIGSELGEIPEGWRVEKIEEICSFDPREKVNKNENYLFFDMKCLSTNSMVIEQGIYRRIFSGSMFKKGDTLIAKITPCLENGKTGFVFEIDNNEIALGSTEFIVLRAKEVCSPYYIYCLSRSNYFRDHAIKSMNGTSGRQRVQIDQLKNFKVPINGAILKFFDNTMKPEFSKIQNNISQIQTLSTTRDKLASIFMKGEFYI